MNDAEASAAAAPRAPVQRSASLFLMLFALAFSDAPFWSLLQAKVAPDLQGRVFAAYLQLIMLLGPLAFLIAGSLADRVFEPARHRCVGSSPISPTTRRRRRPRIART